MDKYEAELEATALLLQQVLPIGQVKHIGLLEVEAGVAQLIADGERLKEKLMIESDWHDGLAAERDHLAAENEQLRAQVSELRDAIENEMSIKEFEEFIARLYPPDALTPTTPEQAR